MPSAESLSKQRYYAHPRNHFWPLMEALFGIARELPYRQRCAELVGKGVAVWDVLSQCSRQGSLDSAIISSSMELNDIAGFLERNAGIRHVFFNGRKSEQIFERHIAPRLAEQALEYRRLPSTSPANAGVSWQEKRRLWQVVADIVE